MMSYEESAAEIRKRHDAIIQNKKNKIKKAITVLSVVLLFTVVGGASIFIGLDRKETPNKPPKLTELPGTNVQSTEDQTSVAEGNESEPLSESESEPEESGTETGTEFESGSEITPEDETPAQSTEEDPPVAPPSAETGGATYTDYSASSDETDDPNVVPPCESGDEDFIDPPYEENKKYTESYSYIQYTYYFEDTRMFYDGVSPLPTKTQQYELYQGDEKDIVEKQRIKDYVVCLYGDAYDFKKFDDDKLNGLSYNPGDKYMTRRGITGGFRGISFTLDLGKVDGYFDLEHDEVIDYVKNMKYYQAAVDYLDIEDPYFKVEEEFRSSYYHSYDILICERKEYLDTNAKDYFGGYVEVEIDFEDFEDDSKDKVTVRYFLKLPYYIVSKRESDTVSYASAVNEILTRHYLGDDLEYVKTNLKCIPRFNAATNAACAPRYDFYVEYLDANGNKYYKFLGNVSMFDEENAYDVPYEEPEIEPDTEVPADAPVVRPTEGPSFPDNHRFGDFHVPQNLNITTNYNSYDKFRDGLINYDKTTLFDISELEKKYLFDTISNTIVSDDEIRYGIFGNFRKNILERGSLMIPYIDGKSFCGEYSGYTDIYLISAYESSRKPSIYFGVQSHDLPVEYSINIYTTYMDPSIAKEAQVKGNTWATSVMFPEAVTADNFQDFIDYYLAQGIDFSETNAAYEKEYNIGGRTILASVSEPSVNTEDSILHIRFVYDDIFVCITVKKSIAEEVLANFALYECDLNTGKPLRDTPGRSEAFWTEN